MAKKNKPIKNLVQLPEHPWFLGCQFHPDFTSEPYGPDALFTGFVQAARRQRRGRAL